MYTQILIPNKNTRELRNNVNPALKSSIFYAFFFTFYVPTKKNLKKWEKNNHHEPVHVRPGGRNLTTLRKPCPWLKL